MGDNSTVKLSWGGSAHNYYLQVLGSSRKFYEGYIKGHQASEKLAPNVFYTWSVTPRSSGSYRGSAEAHHFQLSSELNYGFDGPERAYPL